MKEFIFRLPAVFIGVCLFLLLTGKVNAQCTASTSKDVSYFSSSSGSDSFVLTISGGCYSWVVSSGHPGWITNVSPSSGFSSQTINFQVTANSGAARSSVLTILIYNNLGVQVATDGIGVFQIGSSPGAISNVSSASFTAPVAPESNVSLFGSTLSFFTGTATSTPLPTWLADVSVKVTDSASVTRDAPLFYVSSNQINYQMPSGVASGTATVRTYVTGVGSPVASGTVSVQSVAPGMYSANGSGSGLASGYLLRVTSGGQQTQESLSNPIAFNGDTLYLVLYGTGIRFRSSLSAVTASIGGTATTVTYAGAQGSLVGVDQVNLGALPTSLAGRGTLNINIVADGNSANAVQVTFQ